MEAIIEKTVSTLLQRTDKKKYPQLKDASESVLQLVKRPGERGLQCAPRCEVPIVAQECFAAACLALVRGTAAVSGPILKP